MRVDIQIPIAYRTIGKEITELGKLCRVTDGRTTIRYCFEVRVALQNPLTAGNTPIIRTNGM